MSKKIAIAALIFGGLFANAQASLVGLYTFDNTGNLGLDSSGKGNNASTVSAGYTTSTSPSGGGGKAATFNGINQQLVVPLDVSPGAMPQMTWGAWVKSDSTTGIRAVLSDDNAPFDRDIDMDVRSSDFGDAEWSTFTGSGVATSGVNVTSGAWTFLAATYNQTTGQMSFYVNDNTPLTFSTSFGTTGNLSFFTIGSNPSFNEFFKGTIDNVFVYDQVLSSAQIAQVKGGNFSVSAVPEPASMQLLGSGMALAALLNRRRQKKVTSAKA